MFFEEGIHKNNQWWLWFKRQHPELSIQMVKGFEVCRIQRLID
jgi:hypothetical protein